MANDISVVLNQPCDFPQVDEVWIDYTHAAEEMTKYLLGIGHTRVALINGPASLKRCKERLAGFIKGHEIMGINYSKEIIKNGDFSMDSAYKHTQKLMSLQVPPSCIFTTDFMALGVLNAAADLGLKVPDHLSVAGSDNIATSHPRLTTIDNSSYDMGKIMAKLAISRRKSKKSIEKRSIRLDTKVIVRESTKICEKL